MKLFVSCLVVVAIALSFSCAAFAEGRGPLEKFTTGVKNIITSPGEVLYSVMDDRTGSGMAAGKSHGLLEGASRFIVKLTTGVVEVATFPLPWPNSYDPILDSTEGFKTKKTP